MSKQTKQDWNAWHEERRRFAQRDTEGFTQDLEALKAHILKLQEVCPKDDAGWPTLQARNVLDALRKEFNTLTRYLEQLR